MEKTPFHDYHTARALEALPCEDRFAPVYASSNSKIYPFQIAAADCSAPCIKKERSSVTRRAWVRAMRLC